MRDVETNEFDSNVEVEESRSIKGYIIGILVVLLIISCVSVYFFKFKDTQVTNTGNYDIELKTNTDEKTKPSNKIIPTPISLDNNVTEEPSAEVPDLEEPVVEEPSTDEPCGADIEEPSGQEEVEEKPVIYAYSEGEPVTFNLKMHYDGDLLVTYPVYDEMHGWTATTNKDGILIVDNRQYNYLYWEGSHVPKYDIVGGYCVAKEDCASFLEKKLSELGLNEREQDDFISYWLPRLYEHNYNLISFDTTEYCKGTQWLVNRTIDTEIRVFMTFKGLNDNNVTDGIIIDNDTPVCETTPIRKGFTLVEWGGCEIK